jgi:hypothetical protein
VRWYDVFEIVTALYSLIVSILTPWHLLSPIAATGGHAWMFGFYSQDVHQTSYTVGANLYLASDFGSAVAAKAVGMTSLIGVVGLFLDIEVTPSRTCAMVSNWQSNWQNYVPTVTPYLQNGTIMGFWLGDELVGHCCKLNMIQQMASAVKASFPNNVVYYNEANSPLSDGKPCANVPAGGYIIPSEVDWFSFDLYHWPARQQDGACAYVRAFLHVCLRV